MVFGNKEKKEQKAREEAEARQAARERQMEAERLAQERWQAAEDKRKQDAEAFIEKYVGDVLRRVNGGIPVTFYRETYIPVDAQMNEFGPPDGLDLGVLNDLGLAGWTLESVVPRTYGGFQAYKVSKTTAYGVSGWGKDTHQVGLGGHIVGVYAVMSFSVTKENFGEIQDAIRQRATALLPESLAKPVKRA